MNATVAEECIDQFDSSREAHQSLRLKIMQRSAIGLLLGMVVLFGIALSQSHAHPAWNFVAAFAEAAMVGAIADWFAVVALFRHPMGIPIWHTAIIPNSKDDIGRSLGEFVENHFVTETAISKRLRDANPAALLSKWLLAPTTAPQLGNSLAKAFEKVLDSLDDTRISRMLGEATSRQLSQLDVSEMAGQITDLLVAERKHQDLLDGLLQWIADYTADDKNQPQVAELLLAAIDSDGFVFRKLAPGAAQRLMRALNQRAVDVKGNADHTLRNKFDVLVNGYVLRLKADPDWKKSIAQYQQETLSSPQMEDLLNNIWVVIKRRLKADLSREDPAIAAQLGALIRTTGETLSTDTRLSGWLNQAIESGSADLIRQYRGEVGRFIEDQLAKWTKDEMSQRIELAIGRDLQFIRINGTLVGGLVGLGIYTVTQLVGRA